MSQTVKLPEELTIYGVGQLHHTLLGCLADAASVMTLDAASVDQVDAAGVQLLLSLQQTLHQSQRQLVVADPSDSLRTACEFFGIADQLLAHSTESTSP